MAATPRDQWSAGPLFRAPDDAEARAVLRWAADWPTRRGRPVPASTPRAPRLSRDTIKSRREADTATIAAMRAQDRSWSEIGDAIGRTPHAAKALHNRALRAAGRSRDQREASVISRAVASQLARDRAMEHGATIVALRAQGVPMPTIALRLGYDKSTCFSYMRRYCAAHGLAEPTPPPHSRRSRP